MLSSSRGQANFRGLEASRPRPRTSKCVLEAKDVLEDSTSGSLFTNVPLAETIQICVDSLYGGELIPPDYPKEIFVELMNTATKSVEFSFNNNMYKQTDGVAMGCPLSVALANIFVGYHGSKLLYFYVIRSQP